MKIRIKLYKLISIFFALWLCVEPIQTFAALPSEDIIDMYNKNGIYYYNPNGSDDLCNTSSTQEFARRTYKKRLNKAQGY